VRGEEGTAVLVAQVANGRVLSVAVETSSGFDRLDAAARFAVLRWTFASKEPIRVRIPVSFRLTDVK
jgi:TonB family protein